MRTDVDFSPYRRSTVGFDRLFDMLESGRRSDDTSGFPPFDLIKDGDNSYRIDLAVPGFSPEDIEIVAHQNQLTVSGKRTEGTDGSQYLHRGISAGEFDKCFALADHVRVASAKFENGLLSVVLERVIPEEMKPRKIEIGAGQPAMKLAKKQPQTA